MFCGFLEETTTQIGFGVGRHTLAYQRYHPRYFTMLDQEYTDPVHSFCSAASGGARVREGFCVVG
jgi:hypothetical protein